MCFRYISLLSLSFFYPIFFLYLCFLFSSSLFISSFHSFLSCFLPPFSKAGSCKLLSSFSFDLLFPLLHPCFFSVIIFLNRSRYRIFSFSHFLPRPSFILPFLSSPYRIFFLSLILFSFNSSLPSLSLSLTLLSPLFLSLIFFQSLSSLSFLYSRFLHFLVLLRRNLCVGGGGRGGRGNCWN